MMNALIACRHVASDCIVISMHSLLMFRSASFLLFINVYANFFHIYHGCEHVNGGYKDVTIYISIYTKRCNWDEIQMFEMKTWKFNLYWSEHGNKRQVIIFGIVVAFHLLNSRVLIQPSHMESPCNHTHSLHTHNWITGSCERCVCV